MSVYPPVRINLAEPLVVAEATAGLKALSIVLEEREWYLVAHLEPGDEIYVRLGGDDGSVLDAVIYQIEPEYYRLWVVA
jgi:hypothetical protein